MLWLQVRCGLHCTHQRGFQWGRYWYARLKQVLLAVNSPRSVERDNKQHGKNLTAQPGTLVCLKYRPVPKASQVIASPELTPPVLLSENVNQGNSLTFQCNFLPLVMLSMESRWPDSHIVQRGSHTVLDPMCLRSDNSSAGLPVFTQRSFSLCPQNSLSKQTYKKNNNPTSHRNLSISQWNSYSHRFMLLSQCKFKTGEEKGCFCRAQYRRISCMCFKYLLMGLGKNLAPHKTRQACVSLPQLHFKIRKEVVREGVNHRNSQYPKYTEILLPEIREGFSWFWEIKRFLQPVVDPAQCLGDAKGTARVVAGTAHIQTSSTQQNSIWTLKSILREQEIGWRHLKLGKIKDKQKNPQNPAALKLATSCHRNFEIVQLLSHD